MADTTSSREEDLHVYQRGKHGDPLNAEPKADVLTEQFITPVSRLFHRNHDDVVYEPKVEGVYTDWMISLSVDGDVAKEQGWAQWEEGEGESAPRRFPVDDLISAKGVCKGLAHLDTTATIECAGNRREEIGEQGEDKKAEGIQWGPGVVANVYWTGASIRSLLLLHGVADPYSHHKDLASLTPSDASIEKDCAEWAQSLHLHMLSVQPCSESQRPQGDFFGASIPLSTAMHPNQRCILAYQHNGKTLEQAHGFPIRAVIPGHAGARWVKWLSGLRVSKSENDSPPMQLDYKILEPPEGASEKEQSQWKSKISGDKKDEEFRKEQLDDKEAMQRLGMGSAIESPSNDEKLQGPSVKVRGYAVGQDGSPVSQIECILLKQTSAEESPSSLRDRAEEASKDWTLAKIRAGDGEPGSGRGDEENFSWAWTLWHAEVSTPDDIDEGVRYALVARASECDVPPYTVLQRLTTVISSLPSHGHGYPTREGITLERPRLSDSLMASHTRFTSVS